MHGSPCELMHREEVEDADDAFLCTTLCTNFNHVHSQKMMLFYALLCAQISTMFTVRR